MVSNLIKEKAYFVVTKHHTLVRVHTDLKRLNNTNHLKAVHYAINSFWGIPYEALSNFIYAEISTQKVQNSETGTWVDAEVVNYVDPFSGNRYNAYNHRGDIYDITVTKSDIARFNKTML